MDFTETPPENSSHLDPDPARQPVTFYEPGARRPRWLIPLIALPVLTFIFGIIAGYLVWGQAPRRAQASLASLRDQVNPKDGFTLPVKYGQVGPQLISNGAIDFAAFLNAYEQAGRPLSQGQKDILTKGSETKIVIDQTNAYFLLNTFWALGLANKNPVLDTGPLMQESQGRIEGFASTGGWTIGKKPVKEIYSSVPMINLTAEQQQRLQEAAQAVYRPCCDNPTHFPDCNHGMAMLGLFELMASQDASVKDMLDAAKHVNAYWFPQQTLEQAVFFKNSSGQSYKSLDASMIVGEKYSSGSGFQQVHQWLAGKGLLEQAPSSGGGCSV